MSFWKISKIYPGRPMGATGLKCNFFFFKFATKSLEKKKEWACRPPGATGPCRPLGGAGATGSCFKPWPPFAAIPFVI